MPEGPLGRIGVAVSGADSNVVYAMIEAKKGGLYRSDDGGTNWTLINERSSFPPARLVFTHVWADPKDSNKIYIATPACSVRTTVARHSNASTRPRRHHGL